jgi:hypothetical protein
MIPTPADLRLLARYDRSNPWELAVHGAGHLVAARSHRHTSGGLLQPARHLDPVDHIDAIIGLSWAPPADRAVILFAGYAANEIARDEYRSSVDLVFCVDEDDHDGHHLLDVVAELPDGSAERFLVMAAGDAAALVRDRWAQVVHLAARLHAEGRAADAAEDDEDGAALTA